jgi:hypothetical protein
MSGWLLYPLKPPLWSRGVERPYMVDERRTTIGDWEG